MVDMDDAGKRPQVALLEGLVRLRRTKPSS
jgi:hypothetical protein